MADLEYPRIIYRGLPDTLGRGPHAHPETDEPVGETRRCESADDFAAAQKEGWRLTREIETPAAADDAGTGKSKGKK